MDKHHQNQEYCHNQNRLNHQRLHQVRPDKYDPTLDSDRDGILDTVDECPLDPEVYNRYLDEDGCPDSTYSPQLLQQFPDTDGDGIEDRWDQCTCEPENYNDYLDWDGCPEILGSTHNTLIDSDYDSILDSVDACPLDRENFNNFQDDDGCPDVLELSITGDSDGDGILNQFDASHLSSIPSPSVSPKM